MERFEMGQEELDRLNWLKRAKDGVITQRKAAEKMGVTDRWVRELLARMEKQGDGVVIHALRGKASNRRISEETQKRAMEYLKQPDWYDFGPTFASEQLAKRHDIQVSKETVRGWMIEGGLWKSHSRKLKEAHPWRERRSGYGELTQWDTSDHDWLEGRGEPVRHLVRLIDDATSRSWGRFVQHDGTRENMGVLWEYIEKYGRMVDTYTDRDSMFTVARRPKETEQQRREADRLTQIGRALRELGIGWIAAYSPQAKGRVERSFETDQDRLIKYLRLAKVSTMKAANEFLEKEYWPEWNERFARPVTGIVDLHRPLTAQQDLAASLSHVEHHVIDNGFTFRFAGRRYRILRQDVKVGMRRQRLRIELRLNGEIRARYEGQYVEIAECDDETPSMKREPSRKLVHKDHNAGGKSHWMDGFFERPGPELWQAVEVSNARN
jgi:DNA-binding Lrp family transcriptional regulator